MGGTVMVALGLTLFASGCRAPDGHPREAERAVLRALLDSSYGNDSLRDVLVRERFAPFELEHDQEQWLRDSLPDLPVDAVSDFKRVASDSSAMGMLVIGRGRLSVVPDTTLRRIFRPGPGPDRWQMLRTAYPHAGTGIISLTRVGLSADTTWAVTYIDSQGDWLAGAGYLVVLHKRGGTWHPVRKVRLWGS
jgi:hypothetical protein